MLELIVTLVVLGLLAAIAVPTYRALSSRAETEAAYASLGAVHRQAVALARLDNRDGFTEADFATAVDELAAAPGVSAAGGWTAVAGDTVAGPREVSVSVSDGDTTAGLATAVDGGCAALVVSVTGEPERVEVEECSGAAALGAASEGPGEEPTGPASPVTAAAAVGGDHSITLTWQPGSSSTATLIERRLAEGPALGAAPLETVTVDVADCDPGCTWTFSGLVAGDPYSFELIATSGGGDAEAVTVTAAAGGASALVALHADGSVTTHPFVDWAAGAALWAALEADPTVVAVSYETPSVSAAAANPSPDPRRGDQWGMDLVRAEDVWCYGDGSGVGIAVIDSGVEPLADFGGRVAAGYQFDGGIGTGRSPSGGDHHGTQVSSFIVAQPNNSGIVGAAPGATVVPYDVSTGADSPTAAAALYGAWSHAIDNPDVRVINMSMSNVVAPGTENRLRTLLGVDDPVGEIDEQLGADANAAGKLTVSATGNQGRELVSFPAAASDVLAVGAINEDRSTGRWPRGGSNYGDYVDVVAPGGVGDTGGLPTYLIDGSVTTSTVGTSYAAPQVAALAALIWDAAPGASVAAVREAIVESAGDLGPGGWDARFGWGAVDAVAALAEIGVGAADGCTAPPSDVTTGNGGPGEIDVSFTSDADGEHTAECVPVGWAGEPVSGTGESSPITVEGATIGGSYSCTVYRFAGQASAPAAHDMPSLCTAGVLEASVVSPTEVVRSAHKVLVKPGMRVTETTVSRTETRGGDYLFRNYYWRYGIYQDPEGATGFHGWRWDNNYSQWHRLDQPRWPAASRSFGPSTAARTTTVWSGPVTEAWFVVEASAPGTNSTHDVTAGVVLSGCS